MRTQTDSPAPTHCSAPASPRRPAGKGLFQAEELPASQQDRSNFQSPGSASPATGSRRSSSGHIPTGTNRGGWGHSYSCFDKLAAVLLRRLQGARAGSGLAPSQLPAAERHMFWHLDNFLSPSSEQGGVARRALGSMPMLELHPAGPSPLAAASMASAQSSQPVYLSPGGRSATGSGPHGLPGST